MVREITTAEEAKQLVEELDVSHVKVGVFDIDGVLRGKYMSRSKFLSALDSGFGFCDVVLGWDVNDACYDNVKFTGWHTGYPDASVRIIPESCRALPYEDGGLLFLGEFKDQAEALCPRGILKAVERYAEGLGFKALAGMEYEFFVFDETPDSVHEKDFRDLKPITPGNFGYSVIKNSVWAGFYRELLEISEFMNFPLEGLHEESGPGVLEAALGVDGAVSAADKAALFKTFAKIVAQRHELMATFMARWSLNYPGQSGHIHLSLTDLLGEPVFHDADGEDSMSPVMRHFIGGCQLLLPEFLAMVAPTINSYTRLVPGYWAPTNATWGVENRTCAIRVIPGKPKSQRVEFRVAGADGNPYLALAAALGAGLWGVENEIEPTRAFTGNAYEAKMPKKYSLPTTLWDAAQRFRGSRAARSVFGEAFVEHFAASREWEEREFRKHVTDWELKRYFEII